MASPSDDAGGKSSEMTPLKLTIYSVVFLLNIVSQTSVSIALPMALSNGADMAVVSSPTT
jgi:hypothetical protein